ncbi:MAG: divalent metal cation transporter [Candidatus Berkelbacteria bacterium]|nr:divalent metal cation transporter [Candidatus Berkelbacteria bacterium]
MTDQNSKIGKEKSAKEKIPEVRRAVSDVGQVGSGVEKVGEGFYDVIAGGANAGKEVVEFAGREVASGAKITAKVESESAKLVAGELGRIVSLPYKKRRNIRDFFLYSRKGVITGSADDDPSSVVTYAQSGAIAGFSQLWLLLISTPMLIAIEEMTARIGVVTKKGLGRIISERFGMRVGVPVALAILITNFIIIGADIAAMSNILGTILGISWFWLILPIGLLIAIFLVTKGYAVISRYLFVVTLALLAYVVSTFMMHPPWMQILHGTFLPSISFGHDWWLVAVALVGGTLSAYNFFWQTTEEVEENVRVKDLGKTQTGVTAGMIWSNMISFFIIVATATVFAGKNVFISSPQSAALALKPLAGNFSFALFSIGILGAGLIALPVMAATSAYVISDVFHWREGLDRKFSEARGFYIVIIFSVLASGLVALFGIDPMRMLLYSQVIAGILVPILLVITLKIANSKEIMGEHKNKFWSNAGGWFAFVVMMALILMMILQWLK